MKIGICNAEIKMICNCWRKASKYEVLDYAGFKSNFGLDLCDPKNDPHNEKCAEDCEYREEFDV